MRYHRSLTPNWEGAMVRKEECMEIWALKRQGYSNRTIARKLGIHRQTVKKYLATHEFPVYRVAKRTSGLAPYYRMIEEWLSTENYQATKVHELLTHQIGRASCRERV